MLRNHADMQNMHPMQRGRQAGLAAEHGAADRRRTDLDGAELVPPGLPARPADVVPGIIPPVCTGARVRVGG